jgi:superfamily I DNA/RNA helicase
VGARVVEPLSADRLVVYPTALKAASVLRERARVEGCLLGHRVTTFPELTDALARDLDVPARVLEPEMAAVVLERALARPGVPSVVRRSRPLLREWLRQIAELEAAHLDPDDVARVAEALPPGSTATRFAQLAAVYAAYEAELARLGAVDRHGRERRVCEGLAAAEAAGVCPPTLRDVRRVVFAEIYDFSVLQFLIATSLVRIVGDAELVAFAHAENVEATRFLERTWNRFVGDPAIADQALPTFVERGGRQGGLAAALRGVFASDRPEPAPSDGSIRLVVAPSRYGEVEAAVRDVRRRLERGEPPERIALLARDLALYGDLIEDVCRRYRVPVYFHKGKPLLAHGLVKACVNLLRCAVEGFPRARLEAALDSEYLGGRAPHLARTLRRVGFVAEEARPLADCVAHRRVMLERAASDPETSVERRARVVQQLARLASEHAQLETVVEALRALDRRRTVGGHVRALRRALGVLRVRPVARDPESAIAARRDARAWERFQQTLALLAGVARQLNVEPMPVADFLRLVLAVCAPLEVEDRAEQSGVRALGVLEARGLDFDVVHLLGLDDGTFPAPRAESPLLPDVMRREANPHAAAVLRRKLGARGEGLPLGGLLRTAREGSLEDPFLFFLALSMAERELVLSYPASSESGNPTLPSPFLEEIRACVRPLPTTLMDPTRVVPEAADCMEEAELLGRAASGRWSRRADAPDRLSAALDEAGAGLAVRQAAIDRRGAIEERRSRYFLCPHGHPEKEALADAFVGRLGADLGLLSARLAAVRWTPGRLEALGACGFKFFARDVLGLEADEEPETGVGLAERGTLAHRLLEEHFRASPTPSADPGRWDALRAQVAAAIPAKDPMLLELGWRQVVAAIEELLVLERRAERERAAEGVTVTRLLERPVTRVLEAGGGLTVGGTPDRIDILWRGERPVGLRVVDYKMSARTDHYARLLDPERDLGRKSFQIPVYLLCAVAGVPALPANAELEGGYLVLRAVDKERIERFARAQLGEDGAADSMVDRILHVVARARAGRFDVDPDPCDEYCPYRAVCCYQRPPLEEV